MKIYWKLVPMDDPQILADYTIRDLVLEGDYGLKYPLDIHRLRTVNPGLFEDVKRTIEERHPDKSICI